MYTGYQSAMPSISSVYTQCLSRRTRPPQHDNCIPIRHAIRNRFRELKKPPTLDVKQPQPLRLAIDPIIQIFHSQPPRRIVQHTTDFPSRVEIELPLRRLIRSSAAVCCSDDVQIDALIWGDGRVAFGFAFELVQLGDAGGGTITIF